LCYFRKCRHIFCFGCLLRLVTKDPKTSCPMCRCVKPEHKCVIRPNMSPFCKNLQENDDSCFDYLNYLIDQKNRRLLKKVLSRFIFHHKTDPGKWTSFQIVNLRKYFAFCGNYDLKDFEMTISMRNARNENTIKISRPQFTRVCRDPCFDFIIEDAQKRLGERDRTKFTGISLLWTTITIDSGETINALQFVVGNYLNENEENQPDDLFGRFSAQGVLCAALSIKTYHSGTTYLKEFKKASCLTFKELCVTLGYPVYYIDLDLEVFYKSIKRGRLQKTRPEDVPGEFVNSINDIVAHFIKTKKYADDIKYEDNLFSWIL
jgi:hypothetical protein